MLDLRKWFDKPVRVNLEMMIGTAIVHKDKGDFRVSIIFPMAAWESRKCSTELEAENMEKEILEAME